MTIKIIGYSRTDSNAPSITYQPVEFPEQLAPVVLAMANADNPTRVWKIVEVTDADRKRRAKARRRSKSVREKRKLNN